MFMFKNGKNFYNLLCETIFQAFQHAFSPEPMARHARVPIPPAIYTSGNESISEV
jgi:hypothetical protein